MPILALWVKSAQQRPDCDPPRDHDQRFGARQTEPGNCCDWWQKPKPAQQVPHKGPPLCDRPSKRIDEPNVPSFHREGLSSGPKPGEVDPENYEQERLQRMSVVHRVACLTERSEQVPGNENDAEQQHSFVQPARHPPGQRWRHRRDRHKHAVALDRGGANNWTGRHRQFPSALRRRR